MASTLDGIHLPQLIHNSAPLSHLATIKGACADAERVFICVAYLRMSGIGLLKETFNEVVASGAQFTAVIGTDQYLTEPDALRALQRIVSARGNATALLVPTTKSTFHPKVLCTVKSDTICALVGSANVTGGGMVSNVEASIYLEAPITSQFACDLTHFLDSAIASSQPLDIVSIGQYERRYEVFRNRREKAEKEAARELAGLPALDEGKLKKYLQEYRSSEKELTDRKQKMRNYTEARNVLDAICELHNPSVIAFKDLYGRLVGAQGMDKLWHSGSVFRSINKVTAHRNEMIELVRSLRKQLQSTPEEVFSSALLMVKGIPGIGPNVLTEILNTYSPSHFAVLNKNPISSLAALGFTQFPEPASFKADTYARYCDYLSQLAKLCNFHNLSDVDHFLNYVYWKYARPSTK